MSSHPWQDDDRTNASVARHLENRPRRQRTAHGTLDLGPLAGTRSEAMRAFCDELTAIARHPTMPILIEGEQGSGKTFAARAAHALSPRASQEFRVVDAQSLPPELAVSLLFGHEAGAFTGARTSHAGHFREADHGTVFLDEIAKMDLRLQGMLLSCVEYGTLQPLGSARRVQVDVRVVAAANVDLTALVKDGQFLPDLYSRLEAGRIRLPPLRERREDIEPFLREAVRTSAHAMRPDYEPEVGDELVDLCLRYSWPGNVRELTRMCDRMVAGACHRNVRVLRPEHIPRHYGLAALREATPRRRRGHHEIMRVVHKHDGNIERAAAELAMHRATVYRHLRSDPPGPVAKSSQSPSA